MEMLPSSRSLGLKVRVPDLAPAVGGGGIGGGGGGGGGVGGFGVHLAGQPDGDVALVAVAGFEGEGAGLGAGGGGEHADRDHVGFAGGEAGIRPVVEGETRRDREG